MNRSRLIQHLEQRPWDTPGRKIRLSLLRHPGNRKLDETKVREIKRRLQAGDTSKEIAAEYGVQADTIRRIKRGVQWGHVPWPEED